MRRFLKNIVLLTIIFVVGISYFSCSSQYAAIEGNCIDCFSSDPAQPDSASLVIYVTINGENPKVPLVIYKGKFDPIHVPDTVISVIDTTSTFTCNVLLNQTYSVKAEYKSGTKTIYAIDGSIFNVQMQSGCNNTCWQLIGGILDARLKTY
jgi:hypothetical protein